MPDVDDLLRSQLEHLEYSSPFYAQRIAGRRTLSDIPFLTKEDVRETQRRLPPFGEILCVPRERLVRMHVTSGTTGDPVAIGFSRADHDANSTIGGAAFRVAGVRRDHLIAHCLNYALYAGGVADHMALEASGATVVPVGVGQSLRLLDLVSKLGIDAIFGTLSFPAHLAKRAREAGMDPRSLNLRLLVTAGEPGLGLKGLRREVEGAWGCPVVDTFGMSDVWSTMAGECGESEGMHLTTGAHAVLEVVEPDSGRLLGIEDGVEGEFVWTHLQREASPLLRYRSSDLGRLWTAPCACGRREPRIRIHGRVDDMLRVKAVNVYPSAVGEILGRHPLLGHWAIVAEGDPIEPPLCLVVEAPPDADLPRIAEELRRTLGTTFDITRVPLGGLPVAEQKTRLVYRTARGEEPPVTIRRHR